MSKTDHAERTTNEPREASLHTVSLSRIDEINETIRIFRLEIPPSTGSISFLPGQWLDTFVPGLSKPGGFTITSPPSKAERRSGNGSSAPYLELAVQKSPDNPAAQWLWRPPPEIVHAELRIRVGGSFVWPPAALTFAEVSALKKLVFIAGGVGVNPLMSIISHLAEQGGLGNCEVRVLYSMKDPGGAREADRMQFVERLATIFARDKLKGNLKLFLTGELGEGEALQGVVNCNETDVPYIRQRIYKGDLAECFEDDKHSAVVYICGPPTMTDEFVKELASPEGLGLENRRVLCEKWW